MATNFDSVAVVAGQDATAVQYNNLRKDVIQNAGDYEDSGGAASAYTLAIDAAITAYAAGQVFKFKANHANTGAATLNVNGIGAKTIKKNRGADDLIEGDIISGQIAIVIYDGTNLQLLSPSGPGQTRFAATFGENIDGTATVPLAVHISDGTGGRTSGSIYKGDSNDTTNAAGYFDGFVNTNVISGNSGQVISEGIVGGFAGLTVRRMYYLSTTAGGITLTNTGIPVGEAISATEILIKKEQSRLRVAWQEANGLSGSNTTLTFNLPFRPRYVILKGALATQLGVGTNAAHLGFEAEYDGSAFTGYGARQLNGAASPDTIVEISDDATIAVTDASGGSTTTLSAPTINANSFTVNIAEVGGGSGYGHVGIIAIR